MAMLIRDARISDWAGIEALVRAAWHEHYRTTSEVLLEIEGLEDKLRGMHEEFDASGGRFLVAADGERIAGVIVARRPGTGKIWIDDIFVAADARRAGVGRGLVEAAAAPDEEVSCEVNRRNEAALAMFRSLGFADLLETVVLRRRAGTALPDEIPGARR